MFRINVPLVKPEVVIIDELFEEIAAGRLRIPGFQRPFVWRPSDMISLFDSLYRGYPIGSLLLWETTKQVESRDEVGSIRIPDANAGLVNYILDGQQRLATLYSGLLLPKESLLTAKQKDWRWWIWFDLKNKKFIHVKNEQPEPWLLPIRSVSQTVDFLEQTRKLQKNCEEEATAFIEEAQRVAQKIRYCKIAINRIKGSSLDQAVEIFSRLNTRGRNITPDQMVSALACREAEGEKSLAECIDEILESLSDYHFANAGKSIRMTVFRAIMAAAGKEIHKSDWEYVAKKINQEEWSNAAEKAGEALGNAAQFLHEELGVPGCKLLPYTNQILLLGEFFRHCSHPNKQQKTILKKWFWVSSLSGLLASVNTTQLNKAMEEMRNFAENGAVKFRMTPLDQPARPFPEKHDMRSSRSRAFSIFMLSRKQPLVPETGEPVDPDKVLSASENEAFAYVFPRAPLASNTANRIFLERIPGMSIKKRLCSIPENLRDRVLESHGIPPDACQALIENDAQKFIEARTRHLAEIEKQFIRDLGITVPDEIDYGEADIDTD